MANHLRAVVSRHRIRYQQNGFDLDLAYICSNIIAMGYPAENIESVYRNNLDDVYQFFEEKHHDHYKVYNLCSERNYDISKFHGRVAVFPFDDHNPPPITLIQNFCNDVDDWLKLDEKNVAAVHCKAGKGRTGTMICCYLLHSSLKTTADEALGYYDEKRTKNKKGVTIPSQRRYVEYYAKLLKRCRPYEERKIQLLEIKFSSPLPIQESTCNISERTNCGKCQLTNSFVINFRKTQCIEMEKVYLSGDLKIEVFHKGLIKEKLFHCWLNTYFLIDEATYNESDDTRSYELPKSELDDAHKDTAHKTIPEEFKIRLVFKLVPQDQIGSNSIPYNVNNLVNQREGNCHHPVNDARSPMCNQTGFQMLQSEHNNLQNTDSNTTKRKFSQNNHHLHRNHNTKNNSVASEHTVLRNSDEEVPVKQQNQQGNVDVPLNNMPSVSSDSRSSSSSPSEASSNVDWESGESTYL